MRSVGRAVTDFICSTLDGYESCTGIQSIYRLHLTHATNIHTRSRLPEAIHTRHSHILFRFDVRLEESTRFYPQKRRTVYTDDQDLFFFFYLVSALCCSEDVPNVPCAKSEFSHVRDFSRPLGRSNRFARSSIRPMRAEFPLLFLDVSSRYERTYANNVRSPRTYREYISLRSPFWRKHVDIYIYIYIMLYRARTHTYTHIQHTDTPLHTAKRVQRRSSVAPDDFRSERAPFLAHTLTPLPPIPDRRASLHRSLGSFYSNSACTLKRTHVCISEAGGS